MSIQGNINQAISIAGLLATQSGIAANVKEAKAIQGKQVSAKSGMEDIEKNVKRAVATQFKDNIVQGPLSPDQEKLLAEKGEKRYSDEELKNMESRVKEYEKDIYDAKVAANDPRFKNLGIIDPQLVKQEQIAPFRSNMNRGVYSLSNVDRQMQVAQEAVAARRAAIDAQQNSHVQLYRKYISGQYQPHSAHVADYNREVLSGRIKLPEEVEGEKLDEELRRLNG